MARIGPTD